MPYLKNDSKKVTYPVLFLCGDVKKDVFDFVESLKEEYNLPLQFVPEDTNKNEGTVEEIQLFYRPFLHCI